MGQSLWLPTAAWKWTRRPLPISTSGWWSVGWLQRYECGKPANLAVCLSSPAYPLLACSFPHTLGPEQSDSKQVNQQRHLLFLTRSLEPELSSQLHLLGWLWGTEDSGCLWSTSWDRSRHFFKIKFVCLFQRWRKTVGKMATADLIFPTGILEALLLPSSHRTLHFCIRTLSIAQNTDVMITRELRGRFLHTSAGEIPTRREARLVSVACVEPLAVKP